MLTGARSKLDVQFISRSEFHRHRGTCCIVSTTELVETRHFPREWMFLYTEYTPVACITSTTVFSQARTCDGVLVAQELNGSGLQHHPCAHQKSLSSGQPCHLLVGLYATFSLPVHHNTKHHLDSTTSSKTTLYIEHLLPEPIQSTSSAKEPLSHINFESGRNPRNTSPTGCEPNELATTSGSSLEDINQLYDVHRIWRTRSTSSNY